MVIKLTPSTIRDFVECPRRFGAKEGYIDTEVPAGGTARESSATRSPALALGNTLHAVLEQLFSPGVGSKESQDLDDKELEALVRMNHKPGNSHQTEQGSEEEQIRKAVDILRFCIHSPVVRPRGTILDTEAYLSAFVKIEGVRVQLACRVDRVEQLSDGVLELLDYKVSLREEVTTKASLAHDVGNFIYYLLGCHHYLNRSHPEIRAIRVTQLNVVFLRQVSIEYDREQIPAHLEVLREAVRAIGARNFEARQNRGCSWCPYQADCPLFRELDLNDVLQPA